MPAGYTGTHDEEDADVIDHLKPPLTPAYAGGELLVATDGPEKAYREKVNRMAERLGCIDVRRMNDMSLDQVVVIPSPARRGEGGWVHVTVPLIGS